jgi:hypothetical protein
MLFEIIRWLRPDLILDHDSYHRLRAEMIDAKQWLAEFPDARDALSWLIENDISYRRPLNAVPDARNTPAFIAEFRELLRKRKSASLSVTGGSEC